MNSDGFVNDTAGRRADHARRSANSTHLEITLMMSPSGRPAVFSSSGVRWFRSVSFSNECEEYLRKLLTSQGYGVHLTRATGDLGVDLVAARESSKIAIQVKRQEKKVSRRAVSDAVAGMQHYKCNRAMVITNNYFSDGAATLARSTGCMLVDRDGLSKWILEFQQGRGPQSPSSKG